MNRTLEENQSNNFSSKFANTNVAYQENKMGKYTYQNENLINKIPIQWNTSGNISNDGVRPPNPSMIVKNFNKQGSGFPVFEIEARSPYKVQYLVNQYGGHQTKFGTMIHLQN